jgi:hypothetical protein
MKKSLFALAALILATAAFATGSVGIEAERFTYVDKANSGNRLNEVSVVGSYGLTDTTSVDGKVGLGRTQAHSGVNNLEAGLTKSWQVLPAVGLKLRGGFGVTFPQGQSSVSYVTVDPTATYTVNSKVSVTAGPRLRNTFGINERTIGEQAWVDYKLTNVDVITVGAQHMNGTVKTNSVNATFTRLF